jgi:predicted Fe-Mo cluster-binding NifX family protein
MKIAFTAKGTSWDSQIDPRFGRTEYILVYDEQTDQLTSLNNQDASNDAHGAGPKTASKIADLNVDILITGNGPGGNAEQALRALNIQIFVGAANMSVKEAYNAFKNNSLKKF